MPPSTLTSPFQTVLERDATKTHLIVRSPAMPGHTPTTRQTAALCGIPVAGVVDVNPGDVDCLRCLDEAPRLMHLPGFHGSH